MEKKELALLINIKQELSSKYANVKLNFVSFDEPAKIRNISSIDENKWLRDLEIHSQISDGKSYAWHVEHHSI